uniref:Conserved oligomeric Golgi complex subunit 3 n=2 Tax=Mesocestoides corti TaxID=53468 RepID=A0A5K3F764_MESCO
MCADDNIFENSKCALSEKQIESVFYLNSDDFRPIPQKPRLRFDSEQVPQPEHDTVEIELASQFYAWLGSLNEMEAKEGSETVADLSMHFAQQESYCMSIIDKTDEILSKLCQLKERYLSVSEKTNNLHETCESLLRKQTDLTEKATQIETFLQYFTVLSSIEAKLSARSIIISPDRLEPVLESIDSSIAFLEQHRSFKDSEAYLARLNTCLNTALLTVKEGVKNAIRRVVMEIVELGDAIVPENSFILLYGRFRSQASRIRSLMQLLESRADTSQKYRDVITECQMYYLTKREALVIPVAQASIADLTSKYSRDHCELFRTTVSFMLHMCEDEISLFRRFFEPQETPASNHAQKDSIPLTSMLSNLCYCVYDALRPFLIHINHIEILTELCDLLVNEFLDDQINAKSRVDLAVFENMCQSLLADVRQRLIFRADVYIKSQIHDYEPSAGDLAYPEKLEMIEQIASSLQHSTENETHSNGAQLKEQEQKEARPMTSTSSTDFHGMWYPTVRRTLVCISSLSRCLDTESFQGLAQNCLSACIQSLITAQRHIKERKTASDGQLFFVKHLLILREQTTPFNVEFRVRETSLDFTSIKSAAYQALPKLGSGLFDFSRANTLLRLLLLEGPTVVDTDVDSRRQLDRHLKIACEEFISSAVAALTSDLPAVDKAETVVRLESRHALGPPDQLKDAVSAALHLLSANQMKSASPNSLVAIRRKLTLYLGNPNTVAIMMRPVETGVVQSWRKVAKIITEHYSQEEQMVIACPTESQIRLFFHA